MNVTITVAAEHAGDELRALDRELMDTDEVRGRVRLVAGEPQPGELGVLDETLMVALGQGGAFTAFATVLVAWLRRRVGSVSVKLTKPNNAVLEVSADHLRGLSADQILDFTSKLAADLASSPATSG
jgi:Effector Associated Constant Component 1